MLNREDAAKGNSGRFAIDNSHLISSRPLTERSLLWRNFANQGSGPPYLNTIPSKILLQAKEAGCRTRIFKRSPSPFPPKPQTLEVSTHVASGLNQRPFEWHRMLIRTLAIENLGMDTGPAVTLEFTSSVSELHTLNSKASNMHGNSTGSTF